MDQSDQTTHTLISSSPISVAIFLAVRPMRRTSRCSEFADTASRAVSVSKPLQISLNGPALELFKPRLRTTVS